MTIFVPSALRGWKMASHHMELEVQMVMNASVDVELNLDSL